MADNLINYTQGTAGGTIATDEVVIGGATVHAQRVKIIDGTEGGTAGLAISSSGVAQTFQTNSGTVSVSNTVATWNSNGGTVVVGGVSTGDALEVWSNNGGTVTLGGVSTGDALEVWPNSAGTVSVSNAVAVWVNTSGTIASLPGSLQGYAEDLASSGGEIGVQVLAIRRATAVDSVSADGDFAALQIDGGGKLHTSMGSAVSYRGKTRGGTALNLTASGTAVAAVASNYLKVYSEHFTVQGGTLTVTITNGLNGSTVSGPRQFVPGGGVARQVPVTDPLYVITAGSGLYMVIAGSGTLGGDIAWIQETTA